MAERMTGVELIAAERKRQISEEGRTPEHDRDHRRNQLAWAATCYAAPETVYVVTVNDGQVTWHEPWPTEWTANASRGRPGFRPWRRPEADRIRELVKAGALIAAEIDRLRAVPDEH